MNFHILARNKICNPKFYTSGWERIQIFVFSNSTFLLFPCLNTKNSWDGWWQNVNGGWRKHSPRPHCPSWFPVAGNPCREMAGLDTVWSLCQQNICFLWEDSSEGFCVLGGFLQIRKLGCAFGIWVQLEAMRRFTAEVTTHLQVGSL